MTITIRRLVLFAAVVFANQIGAGMAHADLLDTVKQRGKLVVGIKNDYKPFGYLNKEGKLEGFEIDLARAVAKNLLGSENALELIPVVASNRIELLNAGRIDLILATLGVNENRARVIDFTEAFYDMEGLVLLASVDTPIKKWEDLKGRVVCGMQGNLYNRTLSQKFNAELRLYGGTAEIFKSFQNGRCEAIAFDGPILQMKVNEADWKDKYKIAVDTLELIPIAGGVRKGEPRFLDAVNNAIVKAEADKVLVNAEQRYGMGETKYVVDRATKSNNVGKKN